MTAALRVSRVQQQKEKRRKREKQTAARKYAHHNLAVHEPALTDCYVSYAIEISRRVAISGNGAAVNNNTDTAGNITMTVPA